MQCQGQQKRNQIMIRHSCPSAIRKLYKVWDTSKCPKPSRPREYWHKKSQVLPWAHSMAEKETDRTPRLGWNMTNSIVKKMTILKDIGMGP